MLEEAKKTTRAGDDDDDDGAKKKMMMNRRRALMMTAILATGTNVIGDDDDFEAFAAEESVVDVGDVAPDFSLPATGGGSISLKDVLRDNDYAVVYFYNQDGSSGCSIEAERFNQAQDKFEAKKARVLGISMDSIESHEGFCDKKGLTFSLLSDADGSVSKAYGAEYCTVVSERQRPMETVRIGQSAKWDEAGAKLTVEDAACTKGEVAFTLRSAKWFSAAAYDPTFQVRAVAERTDEGTNERTNE